MKDGRYRIDTSYNCQASLSKEQIMLSSEVITQASDRKALELMVETSDENLAPCVEEVAADACSIPVMIIMSIWLKIIRWDTSLIKT